MYLCVYLLWYVYLADEKLNLINWLETYFTKYLPKYKSQLLFTRPNALYSSKFLNGNYRFELSYGIINSSPVSSLYKSIKLSYEDFLWIKADNFL